MMLSRLRAHLTLWYAGTFVVILLLLGVGVFVAIGLQVSRRLETSLDAAISAIIRATHDLETERAAGRAADAVEELHIPDRDLYLFDSTARPITPPAADDWIVSAAQMAARHGHADVQQAARQRTLRLRAEGFVTRSGTKYVAAAVAERPALVEQYAWLIGTFGAAALVGIVLVIVGGFVLARKSTAPVERSMEQMRRFMADAAHELRTPVAILRARSEVALAHPRDAARDAAAFQAIEREADRLGGIVGDLLTLARADAGELPVAREPLYLDDIASQAVEAARALAERKGVTLEVGAFEEAKILGDQNLARRLLLIVLDNAIKYTPAGGNVRLDVLSRDGTRSVLVTDTGIGIPGEQLPRIFERFYRGESARSHAEGAGLGLAIGQWIADLHGAKITVASASSGTRVQIDFPPRL
jgi:signal transduction histidine kinase